MCDLISEKQTTSVASTVRQIREMNQMAKTMTTQLMQQLIDDIREAIHPGVRQLSTSPNCSIVSSHTVFTSRSHNLSPEYYSSIAQAQLVSQALAAPAEKGLDVIFDRLAEMHEKKQVVVSRQSYMLNEQTLAVIAGVLGLLDEAAPEL